MGNPDTLIAPGVAVWPAPNPDHRIEERRSRLRRHRDARTEQPVVQASSTGTSTGTGTRTGTEVATTRSGGGSVAGDVVVSATAGLAKGALGFQVILMATVAAGQLWFGGPAMMITGRSMEPAIAIGSTVLTAPATATGPMPGDIVSFDIDGATVTHRVIDRNGDELTTRGDANGSSDSTPIHLDEVIGSARVVIPFVGLPNLWLRTRRFAPAAFWIGTNVLALVMIAIDKRRSRRARPRTGASIPATPIVKMPASRSDRLCAGQIPRLPPSLTS